MLSLSSNFNNYRKYRKYLLYKTSSINSSILKDEIYQSSWEITSKSVETINKRQLSTKLLGEQKLLAPDLHKSVPKNLNQIRIKSLI